MKNLKKIFISFSAFSLFFFSLSLTSCTFNNGIEKVINSEIKNFVDDSSVVVRPGVLNEHDNLNPNYSWDQIFNESSNFFLNNSNNKLFSFSSKNTLDLNNLKNQADLNIFDQTNSNNSTFYQKFINLDTKVNSNDKLPLEFKNIAKTLNLINVALKLIFPFNSSVINYLSGISNKISSVLNSFISNSNFHNFLYTDKMSDNYYHFKGVLDAFAAATTPINTNLNYNDAITIAFYNISKSIANLSDDSKGLSALRNLDPYTTKENSFNYFSYSNVNESTIASIQNGIYNYCVPGLFSYKPPEIFPDFKKAISKAANSFSYSNWISIILLFQSLLILINYFSQYHFQNLDPLNPDYNRLFLSSHLPKNTDNTNKNVKTSILTSKYQNSINFSNILNNVANIIDNKENGLLIVQIANIFLNPLSYKESNTLKIYSDFGAIFINIFFITALPMPKITGGIAYPEIIQKLMPLIAGNGAPGSAKTKSGVWKFFDYLKNAIDSIPSYVLPAKYKALIKQIKTTLTSIQTSIVPNLNQEHWLTGLFVNNKNNTTIYKDIINILNTFKIKIPSWLQVKQSDITSNNISIRYFFDNLLFDKTSYFFSNREFLDMFSQTITKYLKSVSTQSPITLNISVLNNLFTSMSNKKIDIPTQIHFNKLGYILHLLSTNNFADQNKAYAFLGYVNNKFEPNSFFDDIQNLLNNNVCFKAILNIYKNYSNMLIKKYNPDKWNNFMGYKNWKVSNISYNSIQKEVSKNNIKYVLPKNIKYNLIYTDPITHKIYTYIVTLKKHINEFVYYHICDVVELTS